MKYLLGETTAGEKQQVKDWLAADPANHAYYEQLKKVWDTSQELAAVSKVDEQKAWERFQQRINLQPEEKQVQRFGWRRIAASVILLLGLGWAGVQLFNTKKPVKEVVIASRQAVMNDTLPDGSVVTLNKTSSITYPSRFKGDTRTVSMKGEAFFNVTPDKKKPFVINVNDVTVTVVGTSFNIKTVKGATEVIVETGIVKVTKGSRTIELKAGERTSIAADSAFEKGAVTDKLYNYYRTKEFVCDNTPLWKLVEVLNEAYNVRITIGREELKDLRLNSPFYNESLDQVLNVISLTFNIRIIKTNEGIVLQ